MSRSRNDHIEPKPIDPVIERLLNRDRIREARMLPEGKLTEDHHDQVREDFNALTMQSDGKRIVSLRKVGDAIGKSSSVITQWVNGNYPGDNDAITRLVNKWVETTRQRERLGGSNFVPTWVAEQMMLRVRMAHNKGNMAAIVSPSGSGKDMVIEALVDEFDGFDVYCDATLTPKQLLVRIGKRCGIGTGRSAAAEIMADVVAFLKGRNTILFINEAQLLKDKCAAVLRAIHDETGVTIALFGSQSIFNLIDDRANGGGQFWSRCHKVNMMEQLRYEPNPEGSGCRPLFTVAEIKAIAKKKSIKLHNAETAKMLASIACLPTFGTLRLVDSLLTDIAYLHDDRTATVSRLTQLLIFGSDVEAEDILRKVGREMLPSYAAAG